MSTQLKTDLCSTMSFDEALSELRNLKFSVASLVGAYQKGSLESELHMLAVDGIKTKIDSMHAAFEKFRAEKTVEALAAVRKA